MELNGTISEIASKLKSRQLSSVELTSACLLRAKQSTLNALNTICEKEAMAAAKRSDEILDRGEGTVLTGIPIVVKDNICTKDIRTTCSSHFLENYIPPYDATVVTKLKEAGAVIVGKANMDEFAMGSSNETSYFGAVKNPVNTAYVPGGSSGGSAASVGGGLAFGALGSDTGGSIRQPASLCGLVGFKPTYGRVSRYGLIAFASSLDQIGTFTRSVKDSAILFNAISGYDEMDSTSQDIAYPDFTTSLTGSLKGLVIGIADEYFAEGLNPEVKASVLEAVEWFKSQGVTVKRISMPLSEVGLSVYYVLACAEATSNLARFDGIKYGLRAEKFENLIDLYTQSRTEGFGAEVKRRIMLGNYVLSSGYYDAYYLKALKVRTLIKREYERAFEECDLILSPTSPTTAFKFGEKSKSPLEMYLSDIYTVSTNIAGLPAISIPCGRDKKGLPIGLQLTAKPFAEGTIFNAADCFEREVGSKWITR